MKPPSDIPNPGVSSMGESGSRQTIRPARASRAPRFQEPIKNLGDGRQVNPTGPVGTGRVHQDVIEVPIPTRKRARHQASYKSADGNDYTFSTTTEEGKPRPDRNILCLFLAIREQNIGGDPFAVFDAFSLKIEDVDNKLVYPLPEPSHPSDGFSVGDQT